MKRKMKPHNMPKMINCSPPFPAAPSKERDQKIALEIFRSSSFLIINKNLLRAWGPSKTIFLENLIDKYRYWKDRGMLQPDGSFFLTHEDQCQQTGLGEHQIRECKRELIGMGILKTQMKGIPAKEYYSINFNRLLDIFVQINDEINAPDLRLSKVNTSDFSKDYTPQKPEDIKNNIIKDNKDNISFSHPSGKKKIYLSDSENEPNLVSSIEGNTGFSTKEINIPFLPLASKLASIIQTNKNIKVTPLKLSGWAADIGKLSRIEGVAPERIEAALDWYADNIGGQYIPVIESGGSLRNKFIKLEEAMKRAGHSPNQLPTNIPSPKKLIQQEFGSLSGSFEKNCFLPAKDLIPDLDKEGKAELTKALIDRFKKIDKQWETLPPEKKSLADLGPITVLARFIEWLGDQAWLTNKDSRIFLNDKIFNSFYAEYRHIGG